MKKLYLSILLSILACSAVAQSSDTQTYINVQPPTVASFMKNIDNPVGLYHGNPEISHTLYTLKDGAIELPISLQYNASGIKVAEEASWVGLGWNLNVGGMIVQQVVGAPDIPFDFTACCLDYYPASEFDHYTSIFYRTDDKYKYDGFFTRGMEGRLQPDVFYFVYPGGSGKFFIDYRDGSIHQFQSDIPLLIEKQGNNGWRITTPEGIVHTFDKGVGSMTDGRSGGTTYYLTGTTYPNKQQVTYTYTFQESVTYHPSETGVILLRQAGSLRTNLQPGTQSMIHETRLQEGTLSSITTTNYQIAFTTTPRNDLLNGRKLDEIRITAKSSASAWDNPMRIFKFAYSYFTSPASNNHWLSYGREYADKRLKLLSVCEADKNSQENNKLTFDYYGTELPSKDSYAVDYWGYYNGQTTNESLIPAFKYILTDQTSLAWVNRTGTAVRAYDFESCRAGMLKRVTYPTQGYMEYMYEPHEMAASVLVPTVQELERGDAGMQTVVAKSQNGPVDQNVVTVKTARGAQVNIHFRIERGLNTWQEMEGCRYVLELCPEGEEMFRVVKENTYTSFFTETSIYNEDYSYSAEAGTYRLTVTLPSALGNQIGSMTKHGYFEATMSAPLPELNERGYNYGGGVRVKQVVYHDGIGGASDYKLDYSYPNPKFNAISFVPLAFHRQFDNLMYVQVRYNDVGNVTDIPIGYNGSELNISGVNLCSAPYSSIGATVGYGEVVVNHSTAGRARYTFTNIQEVNARMSYQIPDSRNGRLTSVSYYDKDGQLIRSEENTYTSTRLHFYSGVSLTDNFNRTPSLYPDLIERWNLLDYGNYDGRYNILFYALISSRNLLTTKTVTSDGILQVYSYTYDEKGQLVRQSQPGNDGRTLVTTYSYPYNYSCEPYTTMTQRHQYAYPVEEKIFSNDKLIGCKLTRYGLFNDIPLPSSITRGDIDMPMTDRTTFTGNTVDAQVYPRTDTDFLKYDVQGNPVHIRTKGEETVYVWGYNCQYPVAEIKGSNYESVKNALGEMPENLSTGAVPSASVESLPSLLEDALVTTYTYAPLSGMKKQRMPYGRILNYEYDGFGRLKQIRDYNGNILEQYEYHYQK